MSCVSLSFQFAVRVFIILSPPIVEATGDLDIVLMKFDERGVHQWTVLHGGPRADEARALQAGRHLEREK